MPWCDSGGNSFWCHCRQRTAGKKARHKHPHHAANHRGPAFCGTLGQGQERHSIFLPQKSAPREVDGEESRGCRDGASPIPKDQTAAFPGCLPPVVGRGGWERFTSPTSSHRSLFAASSCNLRRAPDTRQHHLRCGRVGPRSTFPSCRGCFAEGRVLDLAMRQPRRSATCTPLMEPVRVGGRRHGRDRRLFQRPRVGRPTSLHQPPLWCESLEKSFTLSTGQDGPTTDSWSLCFLSNLGAGCVANIAIAAAALPARHSWLVPHSCVAYHWLVRPI